MSTEIIKGPLGASEMLAVLAGVVIDLGTAGGTSSAFTATSADGLAPVSGRLYRLTPSLTNTSSATLEANGDSTRFIRRANGATTIAGDIVAGVDLLLYYNGTHYRALSGLSLRAADLPVNNGLAYGFLTMTADDASTTTPTPVTWDTNSLSGMTLSSNEITIGETGHYEVTVKAIFAGMTAGTFCILRLEDWTSGSSVVIDPARDAYPTTSTQCYVGINWRGPLTSGTKLRIYQFCGSGASGAIDGDGSTVPNRACFWDIRRVR